MGANLVREVIQMGHLPSAIFNICLLIFAGISAGTQSPRKISPSNIIVENDFVRVSQLDVPPGIKSSFKVDPGRAAVVMRLILQEPSSDTGSQRAVAALRLDRVLFLGGGEIYNHAESAGGYTLREIRVELKAIPPATPFVNDAVALDSAHNMVLLENDRVRIVHLQFPLGEKGPIVDKRPRVIILLTDMHAQVVKPGGQPEPRDGTAGTIYWSLGGSQATMNRNETRLDNIVVELKGK
ncbi:MAG TPA: hypothetical protein VKR82_03360 [Candidatus Acidoferrales bacterium]|nr:hypothetical protein [Candidatus Acidoferrales bacterium]